MKMNDIKLSELKSELYEIDAKHIHPTIKKTLSQKLIQKALLDGGTAFLQTLKINVGASVILIHNIDV